VIRFSLSPSPQYPQPPPRIFFFPFLFNLFFLFVRRRSHQRFFVFSSCAAPHFPFRTGRAANFYLFKIFSPVLRKSSKHDSQPPFVALPVRELVKQFLPANTPPPLLVYLPYGFLHEPLTVWHYEGSRPPDFLNRFFPHPQRLGHIGHSSFPEFDSPTESPKGG